MFWDNVKTLLRNNGKKYSDIAEYLDVKTGTIRYWIYKNKLPPYTKDCVRIAEYFGVTLDYLITGTSVSITDKEKEIVDIYRNIPDVMKNYAAQSLKSLC